MQKPPPPPLPNHGEEVVIHRPGHPQHHEIGVYVGLTYAQTKPQARVRIDGHVYLLDPADLVEN
ncbi:hypothetical protein [Achromobacter insolitus]|uniref:hypothetical protein n=1 Tax=Achromobacter insolitus TaxID=217204 RepID=UPI0028A70E34|nr:hypothetical protein [Achromobacter insolitus]